MINADDEVSLAYLIDPTFEIVNTEGRPLTGGYIEVYLHGTRTKYYCYSDWNGSLHPFKIPLDSLGANIVLASPAHSYDVYIYNKYGTLVMSRYNVVPATGDGTVIKDVVTITSNDNTVAVTSSDQTNWDLSIQDTVDRVEQNEQDISDIKGDIEDIQDDISGKKDKQSSKSYDGSPTKTVTNISQDANGEITVTYGDIDLPPEVPNVEITSEDNSVQITESTDVQTNTKTFDLSVNIDDPLEYGQFRATNVTSQAQLAKIKGNLNLNNYTIGLKKGNSYHFTVRGSYVATSAANTYNTISYIEYSSFNGININVDNTITDSQYFEISYDIYNLSNDLNYNVAFASISGGKVSELWVEVHNLNGVSVNGQGGGTTYTAGDAIDITNNNISVKYGKGLTVNASNQLEVKAGNGLSFDEDTLEIEIDSEVNSVVQTVEKLKQDLDTQLTVNFDMPNVDNVYDFADPTVIGNLSNGAVMLCQAFTVPINHDIRVDDGETENPTLVGIYAKQAFAGKKIMLALYVYDFDTGYTDYVGDTGPVEVTQGRNEFALVHINPNITELKSSCVYYASLYLPSNAHSNGLFLAGCPSYSSASYINATPRFTVGVENITYNNQEIDMTDATTGRLDYNDGNGNYYIGPWSDNYNERPAIPRFFMQIRNGDAEAPVVVEPFTDIGTYTLKNTSSVTDVFGSTITVNTTTYGAMFMEVTPAQDVDVTGWVCYDNYATDARQWYGMVFDSAFENQLSTASAGTLTELGETSTGSGIYGHEFTRTSPLHLTAGTTYRFLVSIPHSNNDVLVQYNTPSVPKNLHLFESGYNVSQWVTYSRANNVQGIDFLIKDANHEWRI
ncbi:hypothetical protein [Pseudobutyrivibrio sp.]|jgi:hypothetical protein|uniref:hypothetical protein n=1 Tax=Pseudobutyrivibrio sp. TaxID=2014367 RepID=UPI0025EFF191|nr:hypothetical protein [Pseudobutyrivibrio sp.]